MNLMRRRSSTTSQREAQKSLRSALDRSSAYCDRQEIGGGERSTGAKAHSPGRLVISC